MLGRLLILLALTLSMTYAAAAEELTPTQEAQAKQIFSDLLSPFCPGRALNDCPSGKANELKHEIRTLIQQGQSTDAITQQMIARFGDEIRANPEASGFGILAWVAPLVFLAGGGLMLIFWLARSREKTT